MAIPKVCGIETEYGIQVVGGDPNPIAASSVLVNAYAHDVARQQIGWDFEDEAPGQRRPGLRPRGRHAPRRRDPPGQHRPHQRGAVLRRPRPPRVLVARVPRRPRGPALRPGGRAGRHPVDGGRRRSPPRRVPPRRLQEQLGRQGQLVRLPRELPHGPRHALQPDRARDHAALRDPPDVLRQRARSDPRPASTTSGRWTTSSASGPSSSRSRSAWRRRSSGPS